MRQKDDIVHGTPPAGALVPSRTGEGLAAWRNAQGQREFDELFTSLANSFSDCSAYAFDLQAFDVVGDMAYTAGLERTSVSVEGQPRTYTLRATEVYRRESGEWRVAHRHGDTVTG